jgi:hypothetical protein
VLGNCGEKKDKWEDPFQASRKLMHFLSDSEMEGWGVAQRVEYLPSKLKTLSSNLSTAKKWHMERTLEVVQRNALISVKKASSDKIHDRTKVTRQDEDSNPGLQSLIPILLHYMAETCPCFFVEHLGVVVSAAKPPVEAILKNCKFSPLSPALIRGPEF